MSNTNILANPRKYNISQLLIELKAERGSKLHDKTIAKILELTQLGTSTFRDYRVARIGQNDKKYCCSVSDMITIMSCINEVRSYKKPLVLEDMYHESEYEKISHLLVCEKEESNDID